MPEDQIAQIGADGRFLPGPLFGIDGAHRSGMLHRGVWLHVLSADDELLLVRRSPTMKTCTGLKSIIGEHHQGRERDIECAARALREEVPGLINAWPGLSPRLLRERPRWFLFDYPGPISRTDRCLISEYVVRLPANASVAMQAIHAGRARELENEASELGFEPIASVWHALRRQPQSFCAPTLLPLALLDSISDLCLRQRGGAPDELWQGGVRNLPLQLLFRMRANGSGGVPAATRAAMPEQLPQTLLKERG